VRAAARAGDASVAFDYYWHGREVRGRRFAGFKSRSETEFLRSVGLEQTVRDEFAVIREGMPNPRKRREKIFCGGHSLGGPLTTAFAGWDRDGDPATTKDAGYKHCAAYFGLDTAFAGFGSGASFFSLASGGSPYVNALPFTPETIQLLGPFGVGAYFEPHGTELIDELPHTPNIDLGQRLLYSRDAIAFATGQPDIRNFNLANEVLLPGLLDDNSQPVTILRLSLGTTIGGPVTQKDFPSPGGAPFDLPLIDNDFVLIPSDEQAPLYRWRNYDRLRGAGMPAQLDDSGRRFTSPRSEFADPSETARLMFEAPANWSEQYFPSQLLLDLDSASEDQGDGHLLYDGIAKRPASLILAGDSDSNSGPVPRPPEPGEPPNDDPLSGVKTLPGYNHVDVVGAAWRQPGKRPERSTASLFRFARSVLARERGD
jgi:hypothetical protein